MTGQFASQSTGELAYNPGLLAQTQRQAPSLAPQQAPQQAPQPQSQPQSLAQPVQGRQSPQQPPAQAGYPQYPSGEVVTGYPAAPGRAQSAPTALSNAIVEFEALTRNGQPPGPPAAQRVPDSNVVAHQVIAQQPQAPPQQQGQAQAQQQAPGQGSVDPALAPTGGWVAPAGHWSRQADLDDETQPWENTITREVGGGNVATTTSALVLPSIPRADPFTSALTSTGEVLLTGSIDLPRSLGATGGDARLYDDPGVDRMFDSQDAEFTGTDSAPVRAIRAVSTHSGSRGVIHANKPRGNRLITLVFIVTAVLAIAVVGMLVASISLGLF